MINISTEAVISLTAATHRIPRRRQNKRCSVATLYRWTQHGVKGIRLETISIGGTRCTSVEALQRFFDALTAAADGQQDPVEPSAASRQRRKQVEAAERRLAKGGE